MWFSSPVYTACPAGRRPPRGPTHGNQGLRPVPPQRRPSRRCRRYYGRPARSAGCRAQAGLDSVTHLCGLYRESECVPAVQSERGVPDWRLKSHLIRCRCVAGTDRSQPRSVSGPCRHRRSLAREASALTERRSSPGMRQMQIVQIGCELAWSASLPRATGGWLDLKAKVQNYDEISKLD